MNDEKMIPEEENRKTGNEQAESEEAKEKREKQEAREKREEQKEMISIIWHSVS